MRKIVLSVAVVCCFGVFSAVAQTGNSTSQNDQQSTYRQSTTTSSEQNSTSAQPSTTAQSGAMNNGDQSGALTKSESATTPNTPDTSQGQQTLEGCLMKDQTGYFVQPMNGPRTQVSGSPDLQSHVGQQVRLQGLRNSAGTAYNSRQTTRQTWNSNQNGQAVSGQSTTTTNNNSMGNNAGNGNSLFLVTQVHTVSTTCPVNPNSQ